MSTIPEAKHLARAVRRHSEGAVRAHGQRVVKGIVEQVDPLLVSLVDNDIDIEAEHLLLGGWPRFFDSSYGFEAEDTLLMTRLDDGDWYVMDVISEQEPEMSDAMSPGGPAGGDLSGSYPNPTVWRSSGALQFGTFGDTSIYRTQPGRIGVKHEQQASEVGLAADGGWPYVTMRAFGPSGSAAGVYGAGISMVPEASSDPSSWDIYTNSGDGALLFWSGHASRNEMRLTETELRLDHPTPTLMFGADTSLFRGGANTLQTNGTVIIANNPIVSAQPGTNNTTFYSYVHGDQQARFMLATDGRLNWGPGSTAVDTSLYRAAATILKTDGWLVTGNGIEIDDKNTGSKLLFGNAQDTNLYRSAAGQLSTDGAFEAKGSATPSRFTVSNAVYIGSSSIIFHDGTNFDTTLYRESAGVVRADPHLVASQQVQSFRGAAQQVALTNVGGNAGIVFGSALDTNLYRLVAGLLVTDTSFRARAANTWPTSATGVAYSTYLGGESFERLRVYGDGKLSWGGGVSEDTNLYRSGAGSLKTDGNFTVGGTLSILSGGLSLAGPLSASSISTAGTVTASGRFFSGAASTGGMWVDGGTNQFVGSVSPTALGFYNGGWHLQVTSAGQILLPATGSGAGLLIGGDANLYRPSASVLKTDGSFYAGQVITQQGGANQIILSTGGLIYFGSAIDTWIGRDSASNVKVSGGVLLGGNGWALSSNDQSARPQVRGGTVVVTADASGNARVNFVNPFPSACFGVICTNGDPNAGGYWYPVTLGQGDVNGFSFAVALSKQDGAMLGANYTVRINYIAYGN